MWPYRFWHTIDEVRQIERKKRERNLEHERRIYEEILRAFVSD